MEGDGHHSNPDKASETSSNGFLAGHSAIQIVRTNDEDHTFTLDEDALNKILSDEKIRDKPVCVLSVAGNLDHLTLLNLPKQA